MADEPQVPLIVPNTRQEIGVLVGVLALFIIVTLAFKEFRHVKNKRDDAKEVERQRVIREKGLGPLGSSEGEGKSEEVVR
jgi:hypothetical protein